MIGEGRANYHNGGTESDCCVWIYVFSGYFAVEEGFKWGLDGWDACGAADEDDSVDGRFGEVGVGKDFLDWFEGLAELYLRSVYSFLVRTMWKAQTLTKSVFNSSNLARVSVSLKSMPV